MDPVMNTTSFVMNMTSTEAVADAISSVTKTVVSLTTPGTDLAVFNATFFYLVGVAGTLVCVVGIAGNSLSIRLVFLLYK